MPKTKIKQLGEFGLIEMLSKMTHRGQDVIRGIGDDAAVIRFSKTKNLLITVDALIEGVHFQKNDDYGKIGRKAMACSLSDIAAMGGIPRWAVVSLGASEKTSSASIRRLYKAMNFTAQRYGAGIVGGDTVRNKKLIINVTLIGEAPKAKTILRSTARVGDEIFVTGRLGASLRTGKHFTFTPRVKEAQYLVRHFNVHAMIDVSDGLAADLGHILRASDVGACLREHCIPCVKGASLNEALYDGEDFELIFTLPKKEAERFNKKTKKDIRATSIGFITDERKKFFLINKKGKKKQLPQKGFKHF